MDDTTPVPEAPTPGYAAEAAARDSEAEANRIADAAAARTLEQEAERAREREAQAATERAGRETQAAAEAKVRPDAEPVPAASQVAERPALSETEAAIGAAYGKSHDGATFADGLRESDLTLARVTETDLAAMRAETVTDPRRIFPPLVAGELVAVDRFGDVHQLNASREDASEIEARFNEPRVTEVEARPPEQTVTQAHAAFAADYAMSPWQRIREGFRVRLANVQAHVAAARNGDPRGAAEGLSLLAELFHDVLWEGSPEDQLDDALRSMAAGRTEPARDSLMSARRKLAAMPDEHRDDKAIAKVDEALVALGAGARSDAMKAAEEARDGEREPNGTLVAKPAI